MMHEGSKMTGTSQPWWNLFARGPRAAVLLLILCGLVLPGGTALAGDSMPKLGIRPADGDRLYIDLTLKPGDRKTVEVELVNGGKVEVLARTFAADAYTMVNGGLAVRLEGEEITGSTTWLDYSEADFDLTPGESVLRDVTITVPKDTAPGEYVAGLVIQNAEPVKGTGSVTYNQVLRAAIAVAVTVPGKREPGLAIGEASYKQTPAVSSLLVEVANTGNVRLKPRGEIVLTDREGYEALRTPIEMDTFFAGDVTQIEVPLLQPLPAGDYSVDLELTDEETGASAQSDNLPLPISD
jgi:WxL Interacting Protein, peptidoglycan binding domain